MHPLDRSLATVDNYTASSFCVDNGLPSGTSFCCQESAGLVEGLAEKTRAALLDSMPKGTNSVQRWFRVLAIAIVCLALIYTVMEALDSSAITDSNFEFEA